MLSPTSGGSFKTRRFCLGSMLPCLGASLSLRTYSEAKTQPGVGLILACFRGVVRVGGGVLLGPGSSTAASDKNAQTH